MEKIATPIKNTAIPEIEVKPQSKPVEEDENPLKPEKKNPNTSVSDFKRKTFLDGSYKKYSCDGIIANDPIFREVSKTMGLSLNETGLWQNELQQIAEMAATYLQDDKPEEINRFIRKILLRTPSNGSRVHNLLRNISILFNERAK